MEIRQIQYKKEFELGKLNVFNHINPNILFVFGATRFFSLDNIGAELKNKFPGAVIIGCSTAGEIFDNAVYEDTLVITAVHIENVAVELISAKVGVAGKSRDAGIEIGNKIKQMQADAVFVLAPGSEINGSELVAGLDSCIGENVSLTGGLAGDGMNFSTTYTLGNEQITTDTVFALALKSQKVNFSYASKCGWLAFGSDRRATKSVANILYQIDNRPALELYKEYLGEKAKDLPASGLLYPIAVLNEDNLKEVEVIRTILNVDEEENSLILAGDVAEGSLIQLMHVKTKNLIEGAGLAADEIYNSLNHQVADDSLAILVSCVGRRIVMADDVDDEVAAVNLGFKGKAILAGFYSYGEICPFDSHNKKPLLHNQTMTITLISGDHAE
ncbi:MAG: FIST N-terminal domain-containing protein [Pseudomonadota bacterium]